MSSLIIFTVSKFIKFKNNSLNISKNIYIESICIKNFLVNFVKKFKYICIKFIYNYLNLYIIHFCKGREESYFETKKVAHISITKKSYI